MIFAIRGGDRGWEAVLHNPLSYCATPQNRLASRLPFSKIDDFTPQNHLEQLTNELNTSSFETY